MTAVVAVVGVAAFLLLGTWQPWPGVDAPPDSVAESEEQNGERLMPSPHNDDGDAPDKHVTATDDKTEAATDDTEADEPEEAGRQRILIRCRDQNGDPVPHLTFSYGLRNRETALDVMRGVTSTDDLEENEIRPHKGVTDADGEFEILEGRDFKGFKAFNFRMKPVTPGYALAATGGFAADDLRKGEFGTDVAPAGGTINISLIATQRVTVSIEYADGKSYEGTLQIVSPVPFSLPESFPLKANESHTFELTPIDRKLELGCRSDRPGFEAMNVWSYNASNTPSHLQLVIPRDPDQCTIVVDLAKWTEDEPVDIMMFRGGIKGTGVGGGKDWTCLTLRPSRAPYRIIVEGKSGVWHSEEFRLSKGGERREFVAIPRTPFRIRARFVDDEGEPMAGACINTIPSRYPDWDKYRKQSFEDMYALKSIAYSGNDGIAEIGGLPAAEIDITLEARECEVIRRTVTGQPGEVVDLGDVSFEPATGRILIDLNNRRSEVGYRIVLNSIAGAGGVVRVLRDVRKDTVVIDKLPRRPYQLFLCAGSFGEGGPVPNPIVDLSESGTGRISVDVGDWKTAEEREDPVFE